MEQRNIDKYASFTHDGELEGYFIQDYQLDEIAVENGTANENGEHTEKTRENFERHVGGNLIYRDNGLYEIEDLNF